MICNRLNLCVSDRHYPMVVLLTEFPTTGSSKLTTGKRKEKIKGSKLVELMFKEILEYLQGELELTLSDFSRRLLVWL